MHRYKFFIFFLLILMVNLKSSNRIHFFGDSHASFCFSNERTAIPRDERSYFLYTNGTYQERIPFKINWLGSKTMHAVGRDGLNFLNFKNYGIEENNIVVFVMGEIDARCHIGKQRDEKKRDLEEIIETLVTNFVNTINLNRSLFNNIYCAVVSVTPPTNNHYNWVLPYHGPIEDRVIITKKLNLKLQDACDKNNIAFLDIYDQYATPQGYLDDNKGDKVVHVNPHTNDSIKIQLIELLSNKYNLFR